MEEQRRFVRLETAIGIHYKTANSSATGTIPRREGEISGGGVRFATGQRLQPGTQLELELMLPGEPAPVQAKGEVVWSGRLNQHRPYEAGVRFTEIDPLQRGKVIRVIHDSLKARRLLST